MKQLRFKAKTYGRGRYPVTWQGRAITIAYAAIIIILASSLDENSPPNEIVFIVVLPIIMLTIALIRICYKTGEKPEWRRGEKKEK